MYERRIEFADTRTHDCPTCGEPTPFEQVPADEAGAGSDEWACVSCGAALVIDPALHLPSSEQARTQAA